MKYKPVQYTEYLKLEQLLSCQTLRSEEENRPAHEEHLFIIVHQAYELWFKQILHDLSSVIPLFNKERVDESSMNTVVQRLERVVLTQKLLLDQLTILETMTPLDFLDFRDLLYPASGFQSLQFRTIENILGLKSKDRLTYNKASYESHFPKEQAQQLKHIESQDSLFELIDRWLARTPFLKLKGFDFWKEYEGSVKSMFLREREIIKNNNLLDENSKQQNYKIIEAPPSPRHRRPRSTWSVSSG